MSADLLHGLLEGGCASTVAVLLVLLLRRPWRAAFGAGVAPLLWAVVPLALLAVWLPAPQITRDAVVALPATAITTGGPLVVAGPPVDWQTPLLALWLTGVLCCAVLLIAQQLRFRRQLGGIEEVGGGIAYARSTDIGPALLGLLRPRIVLPADFHQRYSLAEQALILTHERSHLQRGDLIANAIASVLRAMYWFNPLIHHAAQRLRHDHELASDAAVLRAHPNARRRYADALLNTQLAVPGLPVGCLWQSSHPLRERIMMIKQPQTPHWRQRIGVGMSLAIAIGTACAAWAAQPAEVRAAPTTPAVSAVATHQAVLRVQAGDQSGNPILHFVEGQSFGLTVGEWNADFEYQRLDARHGLVHSQLSRGGRVVGTPSVEFVDGQSFSLRIDDAGASSFSVEGTITPLAPATNAPESPASARTFHPPIYPKEAVAAKLHGKVLVRLTVGVDGVPGEVRVHSATAPGVFDAVSLAAASASRFNPAIKDGKPIATDIMIPYCFTTDDRIFDCNDAADDAGHGGG